MWFRVFSPETKPVSPVAIAEHLHANGLQVVPHFRGDDLGWTTGELQLPGSGTSVQLSRFLTQEDDLRSDLNSFAAELETMTFSPNAVKLMETVIQTQQLVIFRKPLDHADEVTLDRLCDLLVRFLAGSTNGIFQIDRQGWFSPPGELLVQEY